MSPRSGSITTSPQAIIGRDARERAEIEQIYFKLNILFIYNGRIGKNPWELCDL